MSAEVVDWEGDHHHEEDDLGGWDVICFLEMLDQRVLDNEVDFGEEDASVWMSEGPSPS